MDIYLVDHENVHKAGLKGISRVLPEAHVAVFYSTRPNEIRLLEEVCRKEPGLNLEMFYHDKVYKNYEDFQLTTYLGFLIGHLGRKIGKIRVVSKDMGFDAVVDFWKEAGVDIERQETICGKKIPVASGPKKKTKEKADYKKRAQVVVNNKNVLNGKAGKTFPKCRRKAVRFAVGSLGLKEVDYPLIYGAAVMCDDENVFHEALHIGISGGKGEKVYQKTKAVYEAFKKSMKAA